MTQGTKRLTEELHRLEGLKLREILDEMAKTGSPTVVLSFNGTQEKPVAAVALITGPDTADRIEALENPNHAAVPDGWKLVPSDHLPSQMEDAAVAAAHEYLQRTGGNCMKTIYRTLLESAPVPPSREPRATPLHGPHGSIAYTADGKPASDSDQPRPTQRPVRDPDGWSGWACQYPGKMPRLYGDRDIAEVNCDRDNGARLLFLTSTTDTREIAARVLEEAAEELTDVIAGGARTSVSHADLMARAERLRAGKKATANA